MATLVLLEPALSALASIGRALIQAALQFNAPLSVLVLGADQEALANAAATLPHVTKVYWANHPDFLAYDDQAATAIACSLMSTRSARPAAHLQKLTLDCKQTGRFPLPASRNLDTQTFDAHGAGNGITVQSLDAKRCSRYAPQLLIKSPASNPCPIESLEQLQKRHSHFIELTQQGQAA